MNRCPQCSSTIRREYRLTVLDACRGTWGPCHTCTNPDCRATGYHDRGKWIPFDRLVANGAHPLQYDSRSTAGTQAQRRSARVH